MDVVFLCLIEELPLPAGLAALPGDRPPAPTLVELGDAGYKLKNKLEGFIHSRMCHNWLLRQIINWVLSAMHISLKVLNLSLWIITIQLRNAIINKVKGKIWFSALILKSYSFRKLIYRKVKTI